MKMLFSPLFKGTTLQNNGLEPKGVLNHFSLFLQLRRKAVATNFAKTNFILGLSL
jgi:hypothetical protein